MIGIVVSHADVASETIGEQLLACADWEERVDTARDPANGGGTYYRHADFSLRTFDSLHLYLDDVATVFDDPSLVIVASRHSGETGPLLTAHHTGNFGPADYGGKPRTLARAAPNATATVINALDRYAPAAYDVGMECTHHGPTSVGAPSLFVELGSSESEWSDPDGARAVAKAILSIDGVAPDRQRTVVGIGGGHYAPRYTRLLLDTDWAVGHVAADWGLEAMGEPDPAVIEQLFANSHATHVLFDGTYPELETLVRNLGYKPVTETWLRETAGVALSAVDRLEAALCPIADGLRIGTPATTWSPTDDPAVVRSVPSALLDAAAGLDREQTQAALARTCLAFRVTDQGIGIAESVALPTSVTVSSPYASQLPPALVDALGTILEQKYDSVEVTADVVRAERTAFDPAQAAALGVPEGPQFGQLANGQSVEVDGETISPDAVQTREVDRFPLS